MFKRPNYKENAVRYGLTTFLLLAMLTETSAKFRKVAKIQTPIRHISSSDSTEKNAYSLLLKSEQGKIINIAEQKGKVVFINFWALSCIPCKAEMPTINQLAGHFKNDTNIVILPVDVDNTLAASRAYMSDKGFGLAIYFIASPVPEILFHGQLPTTVVIDKNGKIALFREGEDNYGTKEFIDYMDKLGKQ